MGNVGKVFIYKLKNSRLHCIVLSNDNYVIVCAPGEIFTCFL